jgi:hypothetical protein
MDENERAPCPADEASAPPSQDASLLAYLRTLTVEQRLALNDGAVQAVLELRAALARATSSK